MIYYICNNQLMKMFKMNKFKRIKNPYQKIIIINRELMKKINHFLTFLNNGKKIIIRKFI